METENSSKTKKSTSLTLDFELLTELKVHSARTGRTQKELLEEGIRFVLAKAEGANQIERTLAGQKSVPRDILAPQIPKDWAELLSNALASAAADKEETLATCRGLLRYLSRRTHDFSEDEATRARGVDRDRRDHIKPGEHPGKARKKA